ncbi:hypothetical protein CROQUDRAFT_97714 [Cronartium quercuum f. sp. fusiforme G11]|uniref:Uncharacterized protein n=1 Tax=Cronartium quercuum f. sp. fusiforme G11 TaxID=708437 RepID=A0A9P6NAD9_9BASI|nr:hypothetical protein CROQUDRAFT_97714 [Cronartium quercuum f. sp. fusiforme G11]
MLGIDLLSSRSGRELEHTTSNWRGGRYWGPKLNLFNSFLQPYGQHSRIGTFDSRLLATCRLVASSRQIRQP